MDFQMITAEIAKWVPVALSVIGAFALLATKTKNTADNKIAQFLLDIINFLGANFGNAKNDPGKK